LEKNVLADVLRQRAGPEAVADVKRSAERDCVSKYGVYVDYSSADAIGPHELDDEFSALTADDDVMRQVAERVAELEAASEDVQYDV